MGAIAYLTYHRTRGNRVKLMEAISIGFDKFIKLFITMFLTYLIVYLIALIPAIPGIYILFNDQFEMTQLNPGSIAVLVLSFLASLVVIGYLTVHYSLTPFYVVIKEEGINKARKESFQVVKDKKNGLVHIWSFFIIFICLYSGESSYAIYSPDFN